MSSLGIAITSQSIAIGRERNFQTYTFPYLRKLPWLYSTKGIDQKTTTTTKTERHEILEERYSTQGRGEKSPLDSGEGNSQDVNCTAF